jgi:ATPases of the AAA+ class
MGKNKQDFNAIAAVTDIAKLLEDSRYEIFRLYEPALGKAYDGDLCRRNRKDKPVDIQYIETELREEIDHLSRFLKATPTETILFVAVYAIRLIRNSVVDVPDICRYLDITALDFLPLKSSLNALLRKQFIRVANQRRNQDEYIVNGAVELALLSNKPMKKLKPFEMDRFKFCSGISNLIENRSEGDIETFKLFSMVKEKEEQNTHLKLVQELKKVLSDVEDRTLFYEVCDDYMSSRRRNIHTNVECTLDDIYDDYHDRIGTAKAIMNKSHATIEAGLVELLPARFLAEAELALTEKGKRLFLEDDYDLFCAKGNSDTRLLPPDKIPARELFFSEDLTADLNFVKQSLQEESFIELQKRLEENSLPKGVAMLFHGLPGTGKTAAVDMIAKATGRSVYHVDIAASKTCWFGESEKLFKKIFTDYRRMCETEERKPILLFNEADALFSKRRDVDSGNCAQTENALQNILLEEMETLDGILIATTNLCDNFDSAFERRFLFKVKFGQPNTAAKKAIWKSKLSWLKDEDCDRLAAKYDLSGGEIDNIVRKSMMEEVLNGTRPDVAMLEAWCRGEKLTRKGGNAIGFAC